ncbi:MAG: DKNYY domain-containing protein [Muribaculaceae bacterium]|nr:DKNYY domain-containing protein [Muribaculaceae bacterium]
MTIIRYILILWSLLLSVMSMNGNRVDTPTGYFADGRWSLQERIFSNKYKTKMTIAFFILLMALSSCANKETGYNLPYDLPNEVGMWVSVSDTTYTSIYYPVNGSIYATDFEHDSISTYAFLGQSKLPTLSYVDVRTFEVNINRDGEHYARDKRHVYYPTDIDCIMFLDGEDWGCAVFFGDLSIKGADPQTFQYIGKGYAVDKNNMYYRGKKIKWNDRIITALQQDDCPSYLPIDSPLNYKVWTPSF